MVRQHDESRCRNRTRLIRYGSHGLLCGVKRKVRKPMQPAIAWPWACTALAVAAVFRGRRPVEDDLDVHRAGHAVVALRAHRKGQCDLGLSYWLHCLDASLHNPQSNA